MINYIVLFEFFFLVNIGNIVRICVGIDIVLYFIKLLGFLIDDKYMKWVGLDYWDKVKVVYYDDLVVFLDLIDLDYFYIVFKFVECDYSEVDYIIVGDYYFLFGKEMIGLLEGFMCCYFEKVI